MENNRYFIYSKKNNGMFNIKVYKDGEVVDDFDVSTESSLNDIITAHMSLYSASLDNPRFVLNDELVLFKGYAGDTYYILDKSQDKVGFVDIDILRMSIKRREDTMELVNMIKKCVTRDVAYIVSVDNGVFNIELDNVTIKMSADDIKKLFAVSNEDNQKMFSDYRQDCNVFSMSSTKKAIVNEFGELYMYSIDEFNELKRSLSMYVENGDYTQSKIFDVCDVRHEVRWDFGNLVVSANSVATPFNFSIKSVGDLDVESSVINNGTFVVFYSPNKGGVVTITVGDHTFSANDDVIDILFSTIINDGSDEDIEFSMPLTNGNIIKCVSSMSSAFDGYHITIMPPYNTDEHLAMLYTKDIVEYLNTRNILN